MGRDLVLNNDVVFKRKHRIKGKRRSEISTLRLDQNDQSAKKIRER